MLELISLGALVIGVILVTYMALRGGHASRDFADEEAILGEVEIYEAYGRHKEALNLLQVAVAQMPDNKAYRQKLSELETSTA
jgi:hypothetical protein